MADISPTLAASIVQARTIVNNRLDTLSASLREGINKPLHDNPETAYQEFFAHETIVNYLRSLGFDVKGSTYGIKTSFEATWGSGGRQVVYCAEYDALPGLGHACGHNLIATSSIAAFLGAAHAVSELKVPGRLRLLGTPAEENSCGKAALIDAGAFNPPEDVAAAIMAHPISPSLIKMGAGVSGLAGFKLIASHMFRVEFRGQAAHAAGEPWKGVNALDAAVAAYSNVAMLRQHINPQQRIHGVFEEGGVVPGIIPEYTRMHWHVRSPTMKQADALLKRVKACMEAGAAGTGCSINFIPSPTYMNMRVNRALCSVYVEDMSELGEEVALEQDPATASTDMGNVSHIVPSFHGGFIIPTGLDTTLHTPGFEVAAKTDEAHAAAMKCAKGMALMGIRILLDDALAAQAKIDFEKPDE